MDEPMHLWKAVNAQSLQWNFGKSESWCHNLEGTTALSELLEVNAVPIADFPSDHWPAERMATYIADKIDEALICTICGEPFNNPVLIPCGHSFCENCLANWTGESCPEDRIIFSKESITKNLQVIFWKSFGLLSTAEQNCQQTWCSVQFSS